MTAFDSVTQHSRLNLTTLDELDLVVRLAWRVTPAPNELCSWPVAPKTDWRRAYQADM